MADAVACKSRWIAGSATLTMVPSMNAMLEPMMAAIRTQRLFAAGSGGAGAPWRMIASSQGGLPICAMLCASLPRSIDANSYATLASSRDQLEIKLCARIRQVGFFPVWCGAGRMRFEVDHQRMFDP